MKHLFLPFLAGIIFGFGSIIMKILLEKTEILFLLINPIFLITIVSGGIGFLIFQKSLVKEKSSHVALVSTSSTTIISVLGGLLLGEAIGLLELLGIILITLSIFMLILKNL